MYIGTARPQDTWPLGLRASQIYCFELSSSFLEICRFWAWASKLHGSQLGKKIEFYLVFGQCNNNIITDSPLSLFANFLSSCIILVQVRIKKNKKGWFSWREFVNVHHNITFITSYRVKVAFQNNLHIYRFIYIHFAHCKFLKILTDTY